MSILFVINPTAGKGKTKKLIPLIKKKCNENNLDYEMSFTAKPGDALHLAKKGIEKGFKRIIAVGGDGTLNEAINGVAGSKVIVGIIPAGLGNDFIRTINPHRKIEQIITDNLLGKAKSIDLGLCNGRYFVNISSVGIDAEVLIQTQYLKKIFPGHYAYLAGAIKTILNYESKRLNIQIDNLTIEDDILLIAVANGKYYGGGMLPAPEADIEDGIFDVCLVKKMTKIRNLSLLQKYMQGKHGDIEEVRFYKSKKVYITSDKDFAINIDGEVFLDKKANFEILPRSISIAVPF